MRGGSRLRYGHPVAKRRAGKEGRPTGRDGKADGRVELDLLGGFALRRDDAPVHLPHSACRLLALLALDDRTHSRGPITAVLWPDADGGRAQGNLRSTLWRLRRSGDADLLHVAEGLRLSPGADVDLVRGWAVVDRVLADPLAVHHAAGLESLHLDVLPEWDEDWVGPERERYR